jgi:hypothetical protein
MAQRCRRQVTLPAARSAASSASTARAAGSGCRIPRSVAGPFLVHARAREASKPVDAGVTGVEALPGGREAARRAEHRLARRAIASCFGAAAVRANCRAAGAARGTRSSVRACVAAARPAARAGGSARTAGSARARGSAGVRSSCTRAGHRHRAARVVVAAATGESEDDERNP